MSLKHELISTINRFRTTSVKHPIGVIWKNNMMTFYQGGKKWNVNKLFFSSYKPTKAKGILMPSDIIKLLEIEQKLQNENGELIVVPKELGFDILAPNKTGNPLLVDEVRFMTITNKYVLWYMGYLSEFRALVKNLNIEYK